MAYSGKTLKKIYIVRNSQGKAIPLPKPQRINPAQVAALAHFKPVRRA